MVNIYRIGTGGEKTNHQICHAVDFIENNVVGIGFYRVGDISKITEGQLEKKISRDKEYKKEGSRKKAYIKSCLIRFRDELKKGDIVIAYMSPNTIVAVGKIKSGYFFDERRSRDSEEGPGLPHRRKVEWRKKPQFFNRKLLPYDFSSQLIRRGTIIPIYYDFNKIEKVLEKIS